MADLIIHGVPNGHDVSTCDKNTRDFFGLFYDASNGVKTNVTRRVNNDVVYSYLVYGNQDKKFTDYNGRPGSYFGMSLVFHNQYAPDSKSVFNLLKATYDAYVKNKVIKEFPDGSKRWLYQELSTPGDEIAMYISKGMSHLLQTQPELNPKVQTLPPVSNQNQKQ